MSLALLGKWDTGGTPRRDSFRFLNLSWDSARLDYNGLVKATSLGALPDALTASVAHVRGCRSNNLSAPCERLAGSCVECQADEIIDFLQWRKALVSQMCRSKVPILSNNTPGT